jgi:hypothetical protein
MQCFKGAHAALAFGLAIPGLVLVGVGMPLMSALLLMANKHQLKTDKFATKVREGDSATCKVRGYEAITSLRPKQDGTSADRNTYAYSLIYVALKPFRKRHRALWIEDISFICRYAKMKPCSSPLRLMTDKLLD